MRKRNSWGATAIGWGILLGTGALWWIAQADYPTAVLAHRPVGYWRLNDPVTPPTGDRATNSGSLGTAADGFYLGAAWHPTNGLLAASPDSAAWFDATAGTFVGVPANAAFSPASQFTVEFWTVPATTRPADDALVCPLASLDRDTNAPVEQANGWVFFQGFSGWQLRAGGASGYKLTLLGQTPPQADTLYHVVATFDGTNGTLYVNGAAEATGTATEPLEPNGRVPLGIGACGDGTLPYAGTVDEVAIYPVALSAEEVLAHYENGTNTTPSIPYEALVQAQNPLAHWRLNEPAYAPAPTLPSAENLGSLGAAVDSHYHPGVNAGVAGPRPPTYSGFESNHVAAGFNGVAGHVGTSYQMNDLAQFTLLGWIQRHAARAGRGGCFGQHGVLELGDADGGANLEAWVQACNASLKIPFPFRDQEWGFVALVGDGTNVTWFVNGLPAATLNRPVPSYGSSASPFNMGGGGVLSAAGDVWRGAIAEVAVFDQALTPEQVAEIYYAANVAPEILLQPQAPSGDVDEGSLVSLTVLATGTPPLAYQWRQGATELTGAITATLVWDHIQVADAGSYDVVVQNDYGSVTSSIVTLTVQPTNPPVILVPPQSRTRFVGGQVTFAVEATGSRPLRYQWQFNDTDLPDQTAPVLTLSDLTAAADGLYRVIVRNPIDPAGVLSEQARLTVVTPAEFPAAVLADRPMAYWRLGETEGPVAYDAWGDHDGVYTQVALGQPGYSVLDPDGAASFSPAQASHVSITNQQAFNFSGPTPTFTLEAWARFNRVSGVQRLFSNGPPGGSGYGFGLNGNNRLRFTTYGVQDFDSVPIDPALLAGKWYHLVMVSDAGKVQFYVNGDPIGSAIAFLGPGLPSAEPFRLSGNPLGTAELVDGRIDEAVVYNVALSAERVLAHYSARYGSNTPPAFTLQPKPVTIYTSRAATLAATADGTEPITYQWKLDGAPVPGETNETFTVTPPVGVYTLVCVATNPAGSTDSQPATLTVLATPTECNLVQDLVLHLPFDNDYGDLSGRGNHGAPVGAPVFVPGMIGSHALQYNTDPARGTYDYVTLGTPADFNLGTSTNFSVAFWIRFTGWPGDLPFLANNDGSMGDVGFTFAPSYNGGGWSWGLNDARRPRPWPGIGLYDPVNNTLNDGRWHHLTHTFDRAGNGTTYLDGVKVHEMPITSAAGWDLTTGKPVNVGQASGTYPESGIFAIDDLGFWHRVLTPLEIDNLFLLGQTSGKPFAPDLTPPPVLSLGWAGDQLEVSWSGGGVLESTDAVTGQWLPVPDATHPYALAPSEARQFFRVKR